ncbi:MAG: NAD-binding protein [Methanomicrobiales archaeon]|nr:NAD-binding protein [Methanomicrobiales archaeon]
MDRRRFTPKSVLRSVVWTPAVLLLAFGVAIAVYTAIFHHFYPILEGKPISWLESLFFVLETITTVGFGYLLPFENQLTILLTVFMILTGIFMIFMFIPLILQPFIVQMIHTSPPTTLPRPVKGHLVIAGFGATARALIESMAIADIPIVVVEEDEARAMAIHQEFSPRVRVIWGPAGSPATWEHACVKDAHTIIVSSRERRAANIILGLRGLTRSTIIAVVDDLAFDPFLRYAGAEYVLSPKNSTGKILARHAVMRPEVDTIFEAISLDHMKMEDREGDGKALKLLKIPIPKESRAVGKSLAELALLERYGVDVLFFWKAGEFVAHPRGEDTVDASTMLFVLGTAGSVAGMLQQEFASPHGGEALAIIAGFGDVGRAAYHELQMAGVTCVVVDERQYMMNQIVGKAEDEMVLREARVEEARYVIVALNDDSLNIFTTLLARNLNPDAKILVRANEPGSVDRLYRAGADYVALLPTIGGQVLAGTVLSDTVRVLLDLPSGQKVVTRHLMKHAPATVGWVERRSGVRVLGIEGPSRSAIRPAPDVEIEEGDAVIAMGDTEHLRKLIHLI